MQRYFLWNIDFHQLFAMHLSRDVKEGADFLMVTEVTSFIRDDKCKTYFKALVPLVGSQRL